MTRHDPALNTANYDPRARPWYQNADKAGKLIVTPPYVSVTMQQMVVTLAEPVSHQGRVIGVAGADLSLDALIDEVLAMKVQGEGYAMLLDRTGLIVGHPNKELALKQVAELDPGLTGAALDAWSRDGELHGANLNGREVLLSVQGVPGTDWLLAMVMYKEVLEAPLASLLWQLVGLTLVLLLVFGALLIAMFNYLFADLGRVSRALADIAHGRGISRCRSPPAARMRWGSWPRTSTSSWRDCTASSAGCGTSPSSWRPSPAPRRRGPRPAASGCASSRTRSSWWRPR